MTNTMRLTEKKVDMKFGALVSCGRRKSGPVAEAEI